MKYCFLVLSLIIFGCTNSDTASHKTELLHVTHTNSGKTTENNRNILLQDAPHGITRNILVSKDSTIWFATFNGVFTYGDGAFQSVDMKTTTRFFAAYEDKEDDIWLGSIGNGVYQKRDSIWKHLSTTDGLINNEIGCFYEDANGAVWLGANGGFSIIKDGIIRNYSLEKDTVVLADSHYRIPDMHRPPHEVNAIVSDRDGQIWIATRGKTFRYDGQSFNQVAYQGKPFTNVRTILQDRLGNMWIGGNDGLWKYDGTEFTQINTYFTGYLYQSRNGEFWISAQSDEGWCFARLLNPYSDRPSLDIKHAEENMYFGIAEDYDGNVWVGSLNGTYVYDGEDIIHHHGNPSSSHQPFLNR